MMGNQDPRDSWPSPADYGRRYEELNERLARSFALAEYRGDAEEDVPELQYRLAKLALAAEDIRAAIAILERGTSEDEAVAHAIVELRNACGEVIDSFTEANERLVRLLNFVS
jgi:hypothetical protein